MVARTSSDFARLLRTAVSAVLIVGIAAGCDEGLEPTSSAGPETKPTDHEWIDFEAIELLSAADARTILEKTGVDFQGVQFFDVAPYDMTGTEDFVVAWTAVVVKEGNPLATHVDALTGVVLAREVSLSEGLAAHLQELSDKTVGVFTSYPWGYDLPVPFGNKQLTCGYGCGYHTGSNYYAIDLALPTGTCVPAPGSGYCMLAGDRGDGYGKQVIILGGQANGNNRYLYRIAHLNSIAVVPGWWVDKGRTLGAAGCTGTCTGPHVHFSVHRGYYSSGRIFGDSVPLDRWPGPSDRVDYFDRYATWQFSFNSCQ